MGGDRLYGLAALEQRCVRRGHWVIEGFDVVRQSPHSGPWTVTKFGVSRTVQTLTQAREWIADRT